MQILVTGGLGFIGSTFIRHLFRTYGRDVTLVNVDKETYAASPENLREYGSQPNYIYYRGDVADAPLIDSILRKHPVDCIVHFAAESHVDRSLYDPAEFVKTNVVGTQVLLQAAYQQKVKRFIHISTDEVLGSLPEPLAFREEDRLNPSSPYSASKAAAELLIQAFQKTFGYPVVITRSTNNFGPYQYPEKFIPLTVISALQNQPIPIYGKGTQTRDWLYTEDHCQALECVMSKGRPGEVYHIAGLQSRQNIEVAQQILRLLHKPFDLIQHVQDRPAHDVRYALDASKIQRELGWAPHHTFDEALEKTVRWYQENESWWRAKYTQGFQSFYQKHYSFHNV